MLIDLQTGVKEILDINIYWKDYTFAEKLQQLITKIDSFDEKSRKSLVDEYNRLFLVKPKVPPYETTYLKSPGQSEGVVAANVSGVYGRAGLIVSPEMNELPDHIAVQLEFMSFLCEKELLALQAEDHNEITTAQQEQRDFMNEHLARWFPKFAKKALEEADHELPYRQVVETAFAFLRNDLEILETRLEG